MIILGYIVNDFHPLLQTIELEEVEKLSKIKPVLIVGIEKTLELYPNIDLSSSKISHNISFIFSSEESEEYQKQLKDYLVSLCFSFLKEYKVEEISLNPEKIIIKSEYSFLYETDKIVTLTTDKTIYYINKEIYYFFNKESLKTIFENLPHKILSWDNHIFFPSYLKVLDCYASLDSLKTLFKEYTDIDLYCGSICLNWFNMLDLSNLNFKELSLWNRCYDIETKLSTIKVKVNTKLIDELREGTNKFQKIYSTIEGGYITQKSNGTDNTTGRIYVKDNDCSLQTMAKKFRNIVIPEKKCVLVEFDYDYFEYTILSQFCDIPIDRDPHLNLSKLIWGDEEHRQQSKSINYSIIYGQSINKSLDQLNLPNKEEILEKLQEFLIPIENFSKNITCKYQEDGHIKNHFGRIIHPNKDYAILNNFIQSTACDFFIIKLQKVFDLLLQYNSINKIVLQNHDSILLNLEEKTIEDTNIVENIQEILQQEEEGLKAYSPFKYGYDWGSLN